MKISTCRTVNVNLSLTENEAKWLMGFIQNHPDASSELTVEGAIRKELFNELKLALHPNKVPYNTDTASK